MLSNAIDWARLIKLIAEQKRCDVSRNENQQVASDINYDFYDETSRNYYTFLTGIMTVGCCLTTH